MSTTTPTPSTPSQPAAPLAVVLVVVLVAVAALGTIATASSAHAVPSTVLPAPAATGADVVIEPPVVRAPDGVAELDVVLGPDADADVVVELSARQPDVAADGTVTAGAPAEDVTVSTGARLRPGERLRVQATTTDDPVLVVARVQATTTTTTTGSGDDGDQDDAAADDPVEVAALVLPGAPGPAPEATIAVTDGRLVGTVTATSPLLVTARLTGAERTTHPDRLVLPAQPVVLEGTPARWPSPSVLTVTDETGRTVTTDTGRTALAVIAATLLAIALAGAAVAIRRHRQAV